MPRHSRLIALAAVVLAAACHKRPAVAPTVPADIVLADDADVTRVAGQLPRYPEAMQRNAIEARPIAVYVVDTAGRPGLASLRFANEVQAAFRLAICEALGEARFAPVRRDGVARPALFVDPYGFFVGDMPKPWTRNGPEVRAIHAEIERVGIQSYLAQLASRPGC